MTPHRLARLLTAAISALLTAVLVSYQATPIQGSAAAEVTGTPSASTSASTSTSTSTSTSSDRNRVFDPRSDDFPLAESDLTFSDEQRGRSSPRCSSTPTTGSPPSGR